ncbi:MAG TPA: hypothetical protein PKA95_07625 [Thermomicrobiales bacterium]|nr:hypothetical protein [Thermomicrobiales bacterium]
MRNDNTPSEEQAEEIIRRNAEESRKLIEQRRERGEEAVLDDDLRVSGPGQGEGREHAPPGQTNVSSGGTKGPNILGGSSKRRKPN